MAACASAGIELRARQLDSNCARVSWNRLPSCFLIRQAASGMRSFSHPYAVPHDENGQPVSVGTRLRRAVRKSVALTTLMQAEGRLGLYLAAPYSPRTSLLTSRCRVVWCEGLTHAS